MSSRLEDQAESWSESVGDKAGDDVHISSEHLIIISALLIEFLANPS